MFYEYNIIILLKIVYQNWNENSKLLNQEDCVIVHVFIMSAPLTTTLKIKKFYRLLCTVYALDKLQKNDNAAEDMNDEMLVFILLHLTFSLFQIKIWHYIQDEYDLLSEFVEELWLCFRNLFILIK